MYIIERFEKVIIASIIAYEKINEKKSAVIILSSKYKRDVCNDWMKSQWSVKLKIEKVYQKTKGEIVIHVGL